MRLYYLFIGFFICSLNLLFFSSCAGRIPPEYFPTSKSSPIYQKINETTGLTYTAHKLYLKSPILSLGNKNRFYLYVVNNNETKWIRIVFEYNGIDRLLFDKISIKNGKLEKLEWDFRNTDNSTENRHGGIVHEKKDLLINTQQFEKLMKLLKPRAVVEYKFSSNYKEEYPITKESLESLLLLIEYYNMIHLSELK